MIPINNSDTAWLIVSDWNQDNGRYHEELREGILNPETNQWHYNFRISGVGVGGGMSGLAGSDVWDLFGLEVLEVGAGVDTSQLHVGGVFDGQYVGDKPIE